MCGKVSKINTEEFKWKCLNYLGGKKCFRCGDATLPICCYDFHHYNGLKDFELSKAKHKTWKLVSLELEKCVVLCSNCHRSVHYLKEQIKK